MGGPAWTVALIIGLLVLLWRGEDGSRQAVLLVVGLAGAFVLGRIDDRGRLGAAWKWLLQSALLLGLLFGTEVIRIGGNSLANSGAGLVPAAVLVALAVQIALGIFDNLDGVLAVSATAFFGVGGFRFPCPAGDAALAGAGATLAFLCWNRPPARIFLGNGGSQPLSLLAAYLLTAGLITPRGDGIEGLRWAFLLPLSWPLADFAFVSVSRVWRGVPPWTGGRDHTTHRLARRLHSDRKVAAAVALVAMSGALAAYILVPVAPCP